MVLTRSTHRVFDPTFRPDLSGRIFFVRHHKDLNTTTSNIMQLLGNDGKEC
tara:strand:- start:89 stop:241 length:153 start_codon:yes stop_codon:yes gene_type:complete